MKIIKLLTRISGLAIALISLFPVLQAKAGEGEFQTPFIRSVQVTNDGGNRIGGGGGIDWCMPDEFVRQVQSFSILDGKPTRFVGKSEIIGVRQGCSQAARFMIADAFCKMSGFQQAEVFNVTPLNYIYSTNSGRQVRDGSGRVMYTPRIAEGRNGPITIPGWTQIDQRSNGKFDYILCKQGSQLTKETVNQNKPQTSQGGASGSYDDRPIPPPQACVNNFSPLAFQGRTGRVAFYNEWSMPVTVILYHPNRNSVYNRYTVPPGQNQFLGNNIIVGEDWGVCFENKPSSSGIVNNLGSISIYNPNSQGSPLFMIQNDRIK